MDKLQAKDIILETLSHTDFLCIPGLGTFLVQKESAHIDYKKGVANPPYKNVVFNSDIKGDDGVLEALVAQRRELEKEAAGAYIEKYVREINDSLYKVGVYHFEGLGSLLLSNETLRFEQDMQVNIDKDSFGLSKINFNKHIHQNNHLKLRPSMSKSESINDLAKPHKTSKKTLVWISVVTPVVLTVGAFGFLWENRQNQGYASINPFYAASPASNSTHKEVKTGDFNYDDPMGRNTDAEQVEKAEQVNIESSKGVASAVISEAQESGDFAAVDQEKLAKNTVVIKAGELVSAKSGRYYIICASFQTLKKAEAVAKELEQEGYEDVKILEPHENVERYRIALMNFEDSKEAAAKAKELRPKHGNDIWVYKY